MSLTVDVFEDRIMVSFIKNGLIKTIHPLSPFEARLLAQKLIELADEIDEDVQS